MHVPFPRTRAAWSPISPGIVEVFGNLGLGGGVVKLEGPGPKALGVSRRLRPGAGFR